MNWNRIETGISFNDPESGFEFRTVDAAVELSFQDWRRRVIRIEFKSVSHFRFSYLCQLPEFPGPDFYSIHDSPVINGLRVSGAVGPNETANHYVVAHNDDQWCDVVAESFELTIDDEVSLP